MSFGDMLENQLDEDSAQGVCVDRDKYNDQRIINALRFNCPLCGALPGEHCNARNEYEHRLNGQWVHTNREML